MAAVRITALGGVRRCLGWSVRNWEFAGGSVEKLLCSVPTSEGGTLFDLLVEGDQVKPGYTVLWNGRRLGTVLEMQTEVKGEETLVAIDIVLAMTGG